MGKLILFFLLIPLVSNGNIKYSGGFTSEAENLPELESQLTKLNGNIEQLEKNLQDKNQKLLKNIQDRKKIEERLFQVKEILERNQEILNQQIKDVKKYFQNVLVGEVGNSDMPSTLIGKKLLSHALLEKVKELREIKFKTGQIQNELTELQERFNSFVQTENDLSQLLGSLELKKKKLAENYYQAQDRKEKIAWKISQLKAQQNLKKITSNNNLGQDAYSPPIEDFYDVTFKNKGLTFKFKNLSQVFASKGGKVVYSGSLSTYGNVLMIDHGNNSRSVILGDFEITVKKGDAVKKGEIIGHTKGNLQRDGSLYFEIRNKDKVQNTITLMESDFYQNHKNKIL